MSKLISIQPELKQVKFGEQILLLFPWSDCQTNLYLLCTLQNTDPQFNGYYSLQLETLLFNSLCIYFHILRSLIISSFERSQADDSNQSY